MTDEVAVSAGELSRLLAVSPATVHALASRGNIPAFRVGRVWRFFPSQVVAHLEESSRTVARDGDGAAPLNTSERSGGQRTTRADRSQNVRAALDFLSAVDPQKRMTQAEAAEAVLRHLGLSR